MQVALGSGNRPGGGMQVALGLRIPTWRSGDASSDSRSAASALSVAAAATNSALFHARYSGTAFALRSSASALSVRAARWYLTRWSGSTWDFVEGIAGSECA